MKFEEITQYLKDFFKEPTIFDEEQTDSIKEAIDIMVCDVESMIDDEEVESSEEKLFDVLNTTLLISNAVLENSISDEFCKFVKVFSELSFNWNSNTYQDEIIRQLSMYMSRMMDTRNVMLKSIKINKEVDERMRDLSGWAPPAYEISEAYLEQLLEENEND